ncbi:MAG: cytochrome-c peroxidase [Chloroflexi bacterium]|nr:cytochrome-c peroxidase [Chloroflexota bacterium]
MSLFRKLVILGLILSALSLAACSVETGDPANLDVQLQTIIDQNNLTGDPSAGRDLPQITDPVAQLGLKLFFSKALSGNDDTACASCHHPLLGGGDALSLSIGVDADDPDLLGPGRTHPDGPTIPRNTPTTFNAALWDQVMFHDGRIESLDKTPAQNGAGVQGIRTPDTSFGEADPDAGPNLTVAQSRFPVTSAEEMKGEKYEVVGHFNRTIRTYLGDKIGGFGADLPDNEWLSEFQRAFNSSAGAETLITEANIFNAIGEYERSQVFVDTAWKAYVEGNRDAISTSAKQGALLFFRSVNEGGAACAKCHSGDFFTDEKFHVLAIPQIGPGKRDGPEGDDDFGRFRASGKPADLYAFRTPTLLNVEVTGPYGHDGAYTMLEGIVRQNLDPERALDIFDYTQLDPAIQVRNTMANTSKALAQLEENRARGQDVIETITLSDEQVGHITDFLLTLTDLCVKDRACLTPWLPSDTDPPGLQLIVTGQEDL